MELHEALVQIAEIRRQMAKADVFRGYRSAPVAFSGGLALVGTASQALWIPDPARDSARYLALWIGLAVLSLAAVAAEMIARTLLTRDRVLLEPMRLAVEQFLPSLIAGLLVTVVLVRHSPQDMALLPGLWQIFFSLGVFASARLLPRPVFLVAGFYLCSGMTVLILSRGGLSLAPWCMGVPFGVGQLAAAGILYWTLERGR